MARVSTIITNFRAGEFSPRLEGRIDLQKYNEAAKELTNMVSFPQGGITRRPGSYYASQKLLQQSQRPRRLTLWSSQRRRTV